jgi:hypothetical protein
MSDEIVEKINTKLEEILHNFSDCLNNYRDRKKFIFGLNNTLSSIRSFTLHLQKQKNNICNFDAIYDELSIRYFRGNEIMEWLKNARNQVLHEEDLKVNSILELDFLMGRTIPVYTKKVDFDKYDDILNIAKIDTLKINNIKHDKLFDPVLRYKISWRVDDYPKSNILVVVFQGILIVYDFWIEFIKSTPENGDHKVIVFIIEECVKSIADIETEYLNLEGNTLLCEFVRYEKTDSRPAYITEVLNKIDFSTYREIENYVDPLTSKMLTKHLAMAKYFVKDLKQQSVTVLFCIKPTENLYNFNFVNRATKYLAVNKMLEQVITLNCTEFFIITEVWISNYSEIQKGILPEDDKFHGEAIELAFFSKVSGCFRVSCPYIRLSGEVCFEPISVEKITADNCPLYRDFLNYIQKI